MLALQIAVFASSCKYLHFAHERIRRHQGIALETVAKRDDCAQLLLQLRPEADVTSLMSLPRELAGH